MAAIAADEPLSIEVLAGYCEAHRLWVTVDDQDQPEGYLIADVVDGYAHIEQVSVHPQSGGRGLGAALIDHVKTWARDEGLAAFTLTTFRDVPWNAPYYARLGFKTMEADKLGPGLAAIRKNEQAHGLDRWPRVCMIFSKEECA